MLYNNIISHNTSENLIKTADTIWPDLTRHFGEYGAESHSLTNQRLRSYNIL